jgi:hypothetical protein
MAVANYLLVAITVVLGLLIVPADQARSVGYDAFLVHLEFGILTALFTMLAQCIVFTYFLGTTRWVKETTEAYRMPRAWVERSQACRRRAMVCAMVAILLVVATVASGAGAHTGIFPLWAHWLGPSVTYVYLLFAYRAQLGAIETHIRLTDDVMAEVTRIRAERQALVVASTSG